MESMSFHTKLETKHIEGALKGLERGIKEVSGWVWVRRFLRHQKNEPLNDANPAHKQIIALIHDQFERFEEVSEFQEFTAPLKGLLSPIGTGKGRGKKGSAEGKPENREIVHIYGTELGMSKDDVDGWLDHFESNGWKIGGKASMKDWRSALRNGKRMAVNNPRSNGTTPKTKSAILPDNWKPGDHVPR